MGCSCVKATNTDTDRDDFHDLYAVGAKVDSGPDDEFRTVRYRDGRKDQKLRMVKVCRVAYGAGGQGSTTDPALFQAAQKEVELWTRLSDHPHVVSLFEAFAEECFCYLVLEISGRTLGHMSDAVLDSDPTGKGVFRDILSGLIHMHDVGVVHCNLTPFSVFVGEGSRLDKLHDDGFHARLANFGESQSIPECGFLKEQKGLHVFGSPEMFAGVYGYKTDVWSFGVMVYLIMYGHMPYEGPEGTKYTGDIMRKLFLNSKPTYVQQEIQQGHKKHSRYVQDFISSLLIHDARLRCTAKGVLALPYLDGPQSITKEGYSALKAKTSEALEQRISSEKGLGNSSMFPVRPAELSKIGQRLARVSIRSQKKVTISKEDMEYVMESNAHPRAPNAATNSITSSIFAGMRKPRSSTHSHAPNSATDSIASSMFAGMHKPRSNSVVSTKSHASSGGCISMALRMSPGPASLNGMSGLDGDDTATDITPRSHRDRSEECAAAVVEAPASRGQVAPAAGHVGELAPAETRLVSESTPSPDQTALPAPPVDQGIISVLRAGACADTLGVRVYAALPPSERVQVPAAAGQVGELAPAETLHSDGRNGVQGQGKFKKII